MKKLLLTGLTLTAAGMLAACGGGKAADQTSAAADSKADTKQEGASEAAGDAAEVSLWTYPVGKWGDSATVDGIIKKFNEKYPNIKVTVEYLDYQNGDDQINTAIEGKQAPDIVLEGPERLVANWGAKGLMVDLKDMFEKDAASDIYDPVKTACKSPTGEFYEYPAFMVAHCMAINKTMFEKADALKYLDLDTHTWTTDNFLKAVQAVYDSGQQNVGAIYCVSQGGDQGTRALVNNLYSGTFTDKDHTKYTVDSEENKKALQAIVDQAVLWQCHFAGMHHSRQIQTTALQERQMQVMRLYLCYSQVMTALQSFAAVSGDMESLTTEMQVRLKLQRHLSTSYVMMRHRLRKALRLQDSSL